MTARRNQLQLLQKAHNIMPVRNNGPRKINLSPLHVLEIRGDLQGATQTDRMEGRKEQVQMDRNHPSHDPQNGGKAHTHSVTDTTTNICFQPQQKAQCNILLCDKRDIQYT
jgi:hypothetical protein